MGKEPCELLNILAEKLKKAGCILTPAVEAAFRAVPRHLFLPGFDLKEVYQDKVVVVKKDEKGIPVSVSSQPAMMAIMLEQLDVKPGQRVFEVGTGSGYNAALLGHLVGRDGTVTSVDIESDLVENARRHLLEAGAQNVEVHCSDGFQGYPDEAPYDRILITGGAWDICPAWMDQLKPDGRMVVPVSLRALQMSVAFQQSTECLSSTSVHACGFMLLRGPFSGREQTLEISGTDKTYIHVDDPSLVDKGKIYELLTSTFTDFQTGIQVKVSEVWRGVALWLSLHETGFCGLGTAGQKTLVPDLWLQAGEHSFTVGLVEKEALCLLGTRKQNSENTFEIFVRNFGENDKLAEKMIEHLKAWDKASRPSEKGLHIQAYPKSIKTNFPPDPFVLSKQWTTFVVDWKS